MTWVSFRDIVYRIAKKVNSETGETKLNSIK